MGQIGRTKDTDDSGVPSMLLLGDGEGVLVGMITAGAPALVCVD